MSHADLDKDSSKPYLKKEHLTGKNTNRNSQDAISKYLKYSSNASKFEFRDGLSAMARKEKESIVLDKPSSSDLPTNQSIKNQDPRKVYKEIR